MLMCAIAIIIAVIVDANASTACLVHANLPGAYMAGGGFGECPNPAHDCVTTGSPGCSDVACCKAVCALDSFCCESSWDALCTVEAEATCYLVPVCNPFCPANLDLDADVDGADLAVLLGAWGLSTHCVDINGDGSVNGADLAIMLGAWGPCAVACPDIVDELELATDELNAIVVALAALDPNPPLRDRAAAALAIAHDIERVLERLAAIDAALLAVGPSSPGCPSPAVVARTRAKLAEAEIALARLAIKMHYIANPETSPSEADAAREEAVAQALLAIELITAAGAQLGGGGPCAESDHDCCMEGGPGCSDFACCTIVCEFDPLCCVIAWDSLCVTLAESLCGLDCSLPSDAPAPVTPAAATQPR
jgi:hypothetical protein